MRERYRRKPEIVEVEPIMLEMTDGTSEICGYMLWRDHGPGNQELVGSVTPHGLARDYERAWSGCTYAYPEEPCATVVRHGTDRCERHPRVSSTQGKE